MRVRRAAILVCAALVSVSCQGPSASSPDTIAVVTTFTVMADIVEQVGGERVSVESLTRPGVEVHGYEPSVSDVIRTSSADLVIHHGWGLEGWFADFMTRVDAHHVTITDAMEPLTVADSTVINPHAWTSPARAQEYVTAVADALSEVDPAGEEAYRTNGQVYLEHIAAIGQDYDAAVAGVPEASRVLVTCEGAFSYVAHDYGLGEVYLWPINAESQPTSQSIARAIDAVIHHQVPAVFCESTVSADTMMRVVSATDAAFGGTFYVDSLSGPDGPVPTYLDLLRHNAQVLADAWAGQS